MGEPGQDWEKWYRALKASNPEAYRKAIGYVEAVTLSHFAPRVPLKAAADYERATVMLVCELLGVML